MELPKCKTCKKELKDYRSIYCKTHAKTGERNPMSGKYGINHHRFKGGYVHKRLGYKLIMVRGKKMYEHRFIMEDFLGRKLLRGEVVHHINGDKLDNRVENLELTTQAKHVAYHRPMLGKKSKVKRDPSTQRFSK